MGGVFFDHSKHVYSFGKSFLNTGHLVFRGEAGVKVDSEKFSGRYVVVACDWGKLFN